MIKHLQPTLVLVCRASQAGCDEYKLYGSWV
jgi:hypothetical protein